MQTTTTFTGGRYWPKLDDTPYKYVARLLFQAGFAIGFVLSYNKHFDYILAGLNGLVWGAIVGGFLTYAYVVYVTTRIYQQDETIVTEEYEPTPEPRAIQGNRGTLRMRPEMAVSVTHGDQTFVFTPTLLKAMERLYKDRADTNMQHVSRDELGIATAEYPRMIHVLQGVGYLSENNRYTVRGVSWLLVDSYSPTPN